MKSIHYTILLTILITFSSSIRAQKSTLGAPVKLGIEIKQGHKDTYIGDIDPKGLAAATGLMAGDHIKEIDGVALWFTHQVRGTMGIKKLDKPFTTVVQRGGTLHSFRIDPAKPARSWPRIKGDDAMSDCYLSPTAECIIDLSMKRIKTATSTKKRFSARISAIANLIQLDRPALAKAELEKAKEDYYRLSKPEYSFGSIIGALNRLGNKPDKRLLAYSQKKFGFKNGKVNVDQLLFAAEGLGRHGYKDDAVPFVMQAINTAKSSPKLIEYNARTMGRALAAIERYDLMKSYLKSRGSDSEWGSHMLEEAFLYYIKEEGLESAEKVMKIIFTFPRSKTNKDDLIFIRLFKKMQQDSIVHKLTERLENQTKKMDPLFAKILARSLVKAYGARGNIHLGRKTIEKYFKKNSLGPMLDLVIESANSRSSPGLALQYYRDLPKLVSETYQLIKNASVKDKRSNRQNIKKFYLVLAAELQSSITMQEYDAYNFDSYDYEKMIGILVEVRKYDQALAWTVAVEKKFGKTFSFFDVFSMYGASAPLDKIDRLKRHPKFKEYGRFFNRAYLKRLYWKGYIKEAAKLFKTLGVEEKKIAIFGQIPFVSTCKKCDI